MTILSATQLREHIETDLGDTALDRLAAAAESLIEAVIGPVSARTDDLKGGVKRIYTTAAVTTITSIKERDFADDDQVTLSANDWRKEAGFRFIRLNNGDNARELWAEEVEIIYAPEVDTGMIQGVQITLVKQAVVYSGAQRETFGDVDFWHPDLADSTKDALLPLNNSRNRMFIR